MFRKFVPIAIASRHVRAARPAVANTSIRCLSFMDKNSSELDKLAELADMFKALGDKPSPADIKNVLSKFPPGFLNKERISKLLDGAVAEMKDADAIDSDLCHNVLKSMLRAGGTWAKAPATIRKDLNDLVGGSLNKETQERMMRITLQYLLKVRAILPELKPEITALLVNKLLLPSNPNENFSVLFALATMQVKYKTGIDVNMRKAFDDWITFSVPSKATVNKGLISRHLFGLVNFEVKMDDLSPAAKQRVLSLLPVPGDVLQPMENRAAIISIFKLGISPNELPSEVSKYLDDYVASKEDKAMSTFIKQYRSGNISEDVMQMVSDISVDVNLAFYDDIVSLSL